MATDKTLGPLTVPCLQYEDHVWSPSTDYISRSERIRETGPYRSALVQAIAECQFAIPQDVAADLEESARALGEFDSYADTKLGVDCSALGPMSSILLRTESTSSSQIEQLTVSARKLALQVLGEGHGGNAAIVAGNVKAMESALAFADTLDERHLLLMHEALLSEQYGFGEYAGKLRTTLVWVGGSQHGPCNAKYVAPQYQYLQGYLTDLFAFLRRDDMPAIFQCAIAHAQFETIHPFVDGNGRVGRALIHAILRGKGLVRKSTPLLSAALLTDTERYFDALTQYRKGDARAIVERLNFACRFAQRTGKQLIDDLFEELDDSKRALHSVRSDSAVWIVLPLLIEQPIINVEYLTERLGIAPITARRALNTLAEHKVVSVTMGGRRNAVWEHKGIIAALNEYSAGLRRS